MSNNFLPLLADRVFNRPLLIHPDKAATIMHVLEGRITLGGADAAPEASRFIGSRRRPNGQATAFTRVSGNTALIAVDGSLVNRGAWIDANSGLTSYEGIGAQLDEIAADRDIAHVVIDMNSYGGEATGMYGIAAKIRNLRSTKRVIAVINDVAASAGYGIVSSADEIVISPTSLVGSIGVVMMHLDRSAEMEMKGIKPTLIHAGAKKVDGHPFAPLPDHVRKDMQADVAVFYNQFLATVEAGRGKHRLSAQRARETEADVFVGQEAIAFGLADRVGSLDEVLADLSRPTKATSPQNRRPAKMYRDEETAQAVAAERTRIKSILELPEAGSRPTSARSFAFTAGMGVDAAKTALAALPEEKPSAAHATSHIPTIAERAASSQEIGPGGPLAALHSDAAAAKRGWAAAAAALNNK